MTVQVHEIQVELPGRTVLAVREHVAASSTDSTQVVLVHGLASNARLWDGVAPRLAAAGHRALAVDLRGHGLSAAPSDGYDTDTCADDLAALVDVLGLRAPLVAGQSWGGNVVMSLGARHHGTVSALACIDGGWIRLHDRFESFEDCWTALAPPSFEGRRWSEVEQWIRSALDDWPPEGVAGTLANLVQTPDGGVRARLDRGHHRDIVRSLYDADPAAWYPHVQVPVLLCPAAGPDDGPTAVFEALAALPDGRVSWYAGAHHDLHAQHPARLAADLLGLLSMPAPAPHPEGSPS